MNVDLDTRARQLHEWFCKATGQSIPLRMDMLNRWIDWLMAGHNGPEMARVLRYLRAEINCKRRNPGALKLSSLLDIQKFEEDLGLATATRGGFFNPEKVISAPPDAAPAAPKTRPAAPSPMPTQGVDSSVVIEALRKLKGTL